MGGILLTLNATEWIKLCEVIQILKMKQCLSSPAC